MKLKINKKYKSSIKDVRGLIKASMKYQDRQIENLAEKLSIEKDSPEYEILWDHIMNGSDWMIEFVKS